MTKPHNRGGQCAPSKWMQIARVMHALFMVAVTACSVLSLAVNLAAGQAGRNSTPLGVPSGDADKGKQIFKKDGCYECHGSHGQITSRSGPALAPNLIPFAGFNAYVRHPSGSMPGYSEKVLSAQELADVYAFLPTTPRSPAVTEIPILNSEAGNAAH
jgi:ubiquinol-cytochrome c reductase cytochrome c subunit